MNNINVEIGIKLKYLRLKNQLSQAKVATHLYVSQSAYARIENGKTNSWVNYILTLSQLYDIKPEELFVLHDSNVIQDEDSTNVTFEIMNKLINQLNNELLEKNKLIRYLQKQLRKKNL